MATKSFFFPCLETWWSTTKSFHVKLQRMIWCYQIVFYFSLLLKTWWPLNRSMLDCDGWLNGHQVKKNDLVATKSFKSRLQWMIQWPPGFKKNNLVVNKQSLKFNVEWLSGHQIILHSFMKDNLMAIKSPSEKKHDLVAIRSSVAI
jgi:hypothetical protein